MFKCVPETWEGAQLLRRQDVQARSAELHVAKPLVILLPTPTAKHSLQGVLMMFRTRIDYMPNLSVSE